MSLFGRIGDASYMLKLKDRMLPRVSAYIKQIAGYDMYSIPDIDLDITGSIMHGANVANKKVSQISDEEFIILSLRTVYLKSNVETSIKERLLAGLIMTLGRTEHLIHPKISEIAENEIEGILSKKPDDYAEQLMARVASQNRSY